MPTAPNEKDWISLVGDKPTLVLLDELPPYFRNAITQNVGGGTLADVTTYAVSEFVEAAGLLADNVVEMMTNALWNDYDKLRDDVLIALDRYEP